MAQCRVNVYVASEVRGCNVLYSVSNVRVNSLVFTITSWISVLIYGRMYVCDGEYDVVSGELSQTT